MNKILIIRFSSIGDIVLTTPVIRCLKQQLNGAKVHYLTKEAFLPVLQANPYLDKIYTIKNDVFEVVVLLKKEKYDYIIDLHNNLRSLQVKILLQKKAYSLNKENIKKWLMVNLKMKITISHIVDRYMNVVGRLGIINDKKGLDYFINEIDRVNLKQLPSELQKGYIAFAIGARHTTKQLPVNKIIAICEKLPLPVVLLGGTEDNDAAIEIAKKTPRNFIYNACGKYTLHQSASLVEQANWVVSHDTGLMHIAAAFKKRIVSVWGNTVPEFGMYPYLPSPDSKIIEVKNLSCRPCSKIGYSECPKKHFNCMNLIDERIE